jgi:hypothetical protein
MAAFHLFHNLAISRPTMQSINSASYLNEWTIAVGGELYNISFIFLIRLNAFFEIFRDRYDNFIT